MHSKELDNLWVEYSNTKDQDIKDKIILEYLHVVKYVASRLYTKFEHHVEYDDLVGYGIFGLIDAVEKFEFSRGYKFETYSTIRIRGAIIDSIRKLDWVPRNVRQSFKKMDLINEKVRLEYGRDATNKEIAQELGIELEDVEKLKQKYALSSNVSLDEYINQNSGEFNIEDDKTTFLPESEYDKKEVKSILIEGIKSLTEKEQIVINLYYNDELTLKEISAVLSVTESRISQIHSKAISKLKKSLGEYKHIL